MIIDLSNKTHKIYLAFVTLFVIIIIVLTTSSYFYMVEKISSNTEVSRRALGIAERNAQDLKELRESYSSLGQGMDTLSISLQEAMLNQFTSTNAMEFEEKLMSRLSRIENKLGILEENVIEN